ncbi:MAG: hypothetical protein J7513_05100 [Solirubrobacteraceae bacterium]|nr:hypothetical protein [Solirubrobacteraceae bacterium]
MAKRRPPDAERARIAVRKGTGTRYRSTIVRADGVEITLEGGSWNRIGGAIGRVPHDLAHLVVEQELAIRRGLWGILAAGGLVKNAAFTGGRRPPHSAAVARRITSEANEEILRTEVLVRACADASAGGRLDAASVREQVGERWWDDHVTDEALIRIDARLLEHAQRWDELAPGADFEAEWVGPPATARR